jgi:hypothetical protein
MDLFGQAGMTLAKQPAPKRPGLEDDDTEFTSSELLELMELPVGSLADVYYNYLDSDPNRRCRKTRQVWQIICKRKLTTADLGEAWEKLRDEIRGHPCN